MPYHTFNIEEVAQYLNKPKIAIERLVKDCGIPFEKRGNQVVFRQRDIDDWASQRILGFTPSRLTEYHRTLSHRASHDFRREAILPGLIRSSTIALDMTAKTKASVIRDLAAVADNTGLVCDRAELVDSLLAREALCSTAVPGGIAFPHLRHPEPYLLEDSFLVFGRTFQPIHYGAPDGCPTDLFFMLCCQDDQLHLHALARICLLARKTDLLAQLRAASTSANLHESLLLAEQALMETLNPVSPQTDG